ncbi:hypothetical protein ABLA30_12205 [Xenorhabdus nematophila]|uniref:hypothetical protein n=1 Tax=Xenorhabdus nematophila TaxID=628 RepID=UPI0032B7BB31
MVQKPVHLQAVENGTKKAKERIIDSRHGHREDYRFPQARKMPDRESHGSCYHAGTE